MEPRARLLLPGQAKAQAAGVHPALADLGQAVDRVRVAQGFREPIQGGEIRAADEAIPLFHDRDGPLAGAAFDPFVPIERDLHAEGRMPAELERQVAPVFVEDVEVVVIDIGPRGLAREMGHAPGALGHLPHQGRGLGHQDQEHACEGRVGGPVPFGQLVLAHPGGTVAEGNPAPLGVGVHPAAEPAGQLPHMLLVESGVRAGQLPPPVTEPPALLPQGEVAVEDDAVHAVVPPVQQIRIVVGELVMGFHAPDGTTSRRWRGAARRPASSFFPAASGKKRRTYFPESLANALNMSIN